MLVVACLCACPLIINAQIDTLWTRSYSGGDEANCVKETLDNGYIMVGDLDDEISDILVIKTDYFGEIIWSRTYGGEDGDFGECILADSDGGYVILGTTHSFGAGSRDYYLIKTDDAGNQIWANTFGNGSSNNSRCVQKTTDNGYIMTGYTTGQGIMLVKADENGIEQWYRHFIAPGGEQLYSSSIQETYPDGGFIITGCSEEWWTWDLVMVLLKTDSAGNLEWSQRFSENWPYSGGFGEKGTSVIQISDNGYLACGSSTNYWGTHAYVVKTDSIGNELWSWVETPSSSHYSRAVSAFEVEDGEILVWGYKSNNPTYYMDICMYRFDAQGNELLADTLVMEFDQRANFVQPAIDGGYIIAGKRDYGNYQETEFFLVKTVGDSILPVEKTDILCIHKGINLNNYPNPFNPTTAISIQLVTRSHVNLSVYDISGSKVATLIDEDRTPGSYQVTFDGGDLPSGIYFVRLLTEDFQQAQKLVLLR
ncbi:T9SS type A sorting domain-containing protein [bacterium]|nr:T9SS type A sorting domain-containing protein [bacterium]